MPRNARGKSLVLSGIDQQDISIIYLLLSSYFMETMDLNDLYFTFQIDYYGVLDCIHTLMFGEYIGGKIRKNNNGEWELCQKVKRYHETGVWDNLFRTLLNSSSCTRTLLDPIKSVLSSWLDRNSRELMSDAADLENML